jgi:hypothetical protein
MCARCVGGDCLNRSQGSRARLPRLTPHLHGTAQCCKQQWACHCRCFCASMAGSAALFRVAMSISAPNCVVVRSATRVLPALQVVAERWGSLNSLTAGLTEQKAAHGERLAG